MTSRKITIESKVGFVSRDRNSQSEQIQSITRKIDSKPNTRKQNKNFSENKEKFIASGSRLAK